MSISRRRVFQLPIAASLQAQTPAPLNFVFLISDDHSAQHLGCYGDPHVRTPNLDRMAAEGARFTRAYVTAPQCSPNRSSIFTGAYAHTTSTSRLHTPLPPWEPTFLDELQRRGYFTGIFRKHHQGADFQRKLNYYAPAKVPFSDFFDKLPANRPFWLQLGFTDPHRPYAPGAARPPHDPAKVSMPKFLPDWPEVRKDLADYYDAIARMDAECGQLFELLRQRGLDKNTVVLMTGDNGMPFPRAKGTLYEAGINVPLIAWAPGRIAPGQVREELISHLDLAPTWLEAAGAKPGQKMMGRSFWPLLTGGAYQSRQEIFAERNWHDNFDPARCVRTARHKLIFNAAPNQPYRPIGDLEASPTWQAMWSRRRADTPPHLRHLFASTRPVLQLFDLEEDPLELHNLADSPAHAGLRQDLEVRMRRWMTDSFDYLHPGEANRPWPFGL